METPSRPPPPFSPNGTANATNPPNLKPLTLGSQAGPRPLQLVSSNFSTASAPSPRPTLSRSNSTKGTPKDRAFPQNTKRLSSISYSSSSPTLPLASPFNPSSFSLPDTSTGSQQPASPPTKGTPLHKDAGELLEETSEISTAERSVSTMTIAERHVYDDSDAKRSLTNCSRC